MIAVSVVSHRHGDMVENLLAALLGFPEVEMIVLTLNVEESLSLPDDDRIVVIRNPKPKGFGTNHNAAFRLCTQPFFCILNPDIQFADDPFPPLLSTLQADQASLVAPMIRSPTGTLEDSIRYFPNLKRLFAKALLKRRGHYPVFEGQEPFRADWVAGMFMLFRGSDFAALNGFDERFFLYYEDVDICVRLWRKGLHLLACPQVSVTHDARRESHRRFSHMRWHVASMARYFLHHWGRLPARDHPFLSLTRP